MILGSSINLKKHHIDNGDSKINLLINVDNLARIRSNKYLGVQIDSELKWREQISFAIGKISRAMGMLKYAKKYLQLDTVKNIYTILSENGSLSLRNTDTDLRITRFATSYGQ